MRNRNIQLIEDLVQASTVNIDEWDKVWKTLAFANYNSDSQEVLFEISLVFPAVYSAMQSYLVLRSPCAFFFENVDHKFK